ncbi:unnamed protein product, partial [Schistocephalus solidus]|uniref:Glycosyltransferase n=1 Tax=Schistocephalus solidus TaxID=70667 RepID=A0A183TBF2_SCHSO
MGHGFVLVGERPELAWAAYGVAVAPPYDFLRVGRWEVRESVLPGVEAQTTQETLTWFSPPVVIVAQGVAAGKYPTSRSHRYAGGDNNGEDADNDDDNDDDEDADDDDDDDDH